MYQLGRTSKQRLSTTAIDIQKIIEMAIKVTPVDFGVAEGHRSIEDQQKYFKEGKSKIDGVTKKSKHNLSPSQAVDVYAFVNGKASWDKNHLCIIAGVILACAEYLRQTGEINKKIRWGGNWDMDGEIISDQTFQDLPHFELI